MGLPQGDIFTADAAGRVSVSLTQEQDIPVEGRLTGFGTVSLSVYDYRLLEAMEQLNQKLDVLISIVGKFK